MCSKTQVIEVTVKNKEFLPEKELLSATVFLVGLLIEMLMSPAN